LLTSSGKQIQRLDMYGGPSALHVFFDFIITHKYGKHK